MKSPLLTLQAFQLADHAKPGTPDVYWCIVKSTATATGEVSYHYCFCEFTTRWLRPVLRGQEFEIVAWCELENPGIYFRQKKMRATA